jgi:hypothetical protein
MPDNLLTLSRPPGSPNPVLFGSVAVDLGGLRFEDWEAVRVRARSHDRLASIMVSYDLGEELYFRNSSRWIDA